MANKLGGERHPATLKRMSRGQRFTLKPIEEQRRAIERIQGGINPPQQVFSNDNDGSKAFMVRQFRVLSIQGDYLTVNPFNGFSYDEKIKILVAKPYLLRKSLTSRNGIAYTFASDAAGMAGTERTATEGADTETQVVVPSFVEGDVLYAARGITGGTGVTFLSSGGENKDVAWIDLNTDGRAWAKKA